MQLLIRIGRWFFALALIAFGVQHLLYREFVTRVVLSWPPTLPGPPLAALVVGAVLVAAGVALLFGWRTREVGAACGVLLLASFVFLSLPVARADCRWCGQWTSALKTLALCGEAWIVAATATASPGLRGMMSGAGRICFAAFLVLCGIQHFIWSGFVSSLVPVWMPYKMFWTYFAGIALVAAGIGIVVPRTRRLAGALTGIMIFSWVFMIHLPRAIHYLGQQKGNETTALFEAIAFSGMAFIIAATKGR
jgi:uncharacterized membrane protein